MSPPQHAPTATLTVPDGGVSGYDLYFIESDAQVSGSVTEYGRPPT